MVDKLASLRTDAASNIRATLDNGEHVLRERQVLRVEAIAADLENGHSCGHVQSPTGTGKTIMFGETIRIVGMKSLVLVPRKNLADQTKEKFVEKLGFKEEDVGVFHSGVTLAEREAALQANVLVTTYSSFMNLVKKENVGFGDYPYVVLDESHTSKSENRRRLAARLAEEAIVHAWTATDSFIEKGQLVHVGQALFGREDAIHRTSFREAVEHGEIAPTKNIVFQTNLDPRIVPSGDEFTAEEQKKIVTQTGRDEAAVNAFASFEDEAIGAVLRNKKSIWFASGIDHAERIATKLNEVFGEGYAAAVNGSMDSKKELSPIYAAHREGSIRALVNADLLIEGYDDPSVEISVMLRPAQSRLLVEQAGGRATRLDPDNHNAIKYVLSFVDSNQPQVVVFGEVVGGMEFIPRAIQPREKTGEEREYTPRVRLNSEVGIVPIYEQETVHEFLIAREKQREALQAAPPLLTGFLNKEQMMWELQSSPPKVNPVYDALETAWDQARQQKPMPEAITIQEQEKTLTLSAAHMGKFHNGVNTAFYVSEEAALEVKAYLGIKEHQGKLDGTKLPYVKMKKEVEIHGQRMKLLYETLEPAWNKAQQPDSRLSEITIAFEGKDLVLPTASMGYYKTSTVVSFCLDSNCTEPLKTFFGKKEHLGKRPEGFLNREVMAKKVEISSSRINALFDAVEIGWDEARKQNPAPESLTLSLQERTLTLSMDKIGRYKEQGRDAFYISEDSISELKNYFGKKENLGKKPAGFLNREQMCRALETSPPRVNKVYDILEAAWEVAQKLDSAPEQITITQEGRNLTLPMADMGRYHNKNTAFYVNEAHLPEIRSHLGIKMHLGQQPVDMLNVPQAAKSARITPTRIRPIFEVLAQAWESAREQNPVPAEISIEREGRRLTLPIEKMGLYKTATIPTFCVSTECMNDLRGFFGKDKGNGRDAASFKKAPFEPTSIKPGSADLARTGKQRGKDEE